MHPHNYTLNKVRHPCLGLREASNCQVGGALVCIGIQYNTSYSECIPLVGTIESIHFCVMEILYSIAMVRRQNTRLVYHVYLLQRTMFDSATCAALRKRYNVECERYGGKLCRGYHRQGCIGPDIEAGTCARFGVSTM